MHVVALDRMSWVFLVVLAALGLTCTWVASASAAMIRPLGPIVASGDSSVLAYQHSSVDQPLRGSGPVTILARTAETWSERQFTPPSDCTFASASNRAVMLGCGDARAPRPVLVDAATGATSDAPFANKMVEFESSHTSIGGGDLFWQLSGLGRRLLEVSAAAYKTSLVELLDMATGRIFAAPRASPHTVPSLDRANGRARLCRPIVRPWHGAHDRIYYESVQYRRPWMAFVTSNAMRGIHHRNHEQIGLQHCGTRRKIVLSHTQGPVLLGPTYVAWRLAPPSGWRRVLHVRVLKTGRTLRLRLPSACDGGIRGGGRYLIVGYCLIDLGRVFNPGPTPEDPA